MDTVV